MQRIKASHPVVGGCVVHDCGAEMGKHQVDWDQNSAYLAVFDHCVLAFQALLCAMNGTVRCGTQMLLRVDAVVVVGEALALGPWVPSFQRAAAADPLPSLARPLSPSLTKTIEASAGE